MARTNTGSYFFGIDPSSFWKTTGGQSYMFPQYGLDTSTGKRDTEKVSQSLTNQPFATGSESIQFSPIPTYTTASPIDTSSYENFLDRFGKKTFEADVKQQLLGLGSGLAFSAASLPFAERLRNVDYQLGLQADINSPTRKAARDASRQKQLTDSIGAEADYLRALAAVRQGAASGINVSI